jgi:Pirin C-terminal cupin domain
VLHANFLVRIRRAHRSGHARNNRGKPRASRGKARIPLSACLGGEPLHEPIVGHGPFVMNTREEIEQAFRDYQTGKF